VKYIPLRAESDPEGGTLDWRDISRQVIRRPLDMQKGADVDEMRKGIRLLDAIDAAEGDWLALEDADWEHLKEKVLKFAWGVVARPALRYIDDVVGAADKPSVNGLLVESVEPA